MEFIINQRGNSIVASVQAEEIVLGSVQDALDIVANANYVAGANKIIVPKALIAEEFFELRSGLAGAVLQKFINYKARLAIVGDFSGYTSKALRDFIYESNNGKDIFFLPDMESALDKLHALEVW